MDGWVEWIIFMIMMVVGGVGILVFFTNPLIVIVGAAAVALALWVVGPTTRVR